MSNFDSLRKYFIDIDEEIFSADYFISSKAVNLFNKMASMIPEDNPFHDILSEINTIRNFMMDHPSYQDHKISSVSSKIFKCIELLSSYLTDEEIDSVKYKIEYIAHSNHTPETKSYKLLNLLYDVVEDICNEITNKVEATKEDIDELEDEISEKKVGKVEDTKEDIEESQDSNKNKNKLKLNQSKKGRSNMKKGMNKLMKQMMDNCMPVEINDGSVALSMTGGIVIKRRNGDYVRYDSTKDEIINEMEFVLDDDSISKMLFLLPVNSIKNNDIVKVNDRYYNIVNAEKFEAIDLESGTRETLITEGNMVFGNSMFKKVISLFSMNGSEINPFMFYAMNKSKDSDSKDSDELFKMIAMSNIMNAAGNNNNIFGNQTTFQNSMMMMAMCDNSMAKGLLMIEMMNNNMGGINNSSDQNPGNNINENLLKHCMMSSLLEDESEDEESDIEVRNEDDSE